MLASYIHIAYNMHVNRIGKIIEISNSLLGQLLLLKYSYSFLIILVSSQLTLYRQEIAFWVKVLVDFYHVS